MIESERMVRIFDADDREIDYIVVRRSDDVVGWRFGEAVPIPDPKLPSATGGTFTLTAHGNERFTLDVKDKRL